jgi:MarR-like DNA-binding transcriptional regulator SgrR of sgrS sRNA
MLRAATAMDCRAQHICTEQKATKYTQTSAFSHGFSNPSFCPVLVHHHNPAPHRYAMRAHISTAPHRDRGEGHRYDNRADGVHPELCRQAWKHHPAEEGPARMKHAALYMRVSTLDQHLETQLLDLRQLASQRGLEIVQEYTDRISGAKARRPGLDQMMANARHGRFDVVMV